MIAVRALKGIREQNSSQSIPLFPSFFLRPSCISEERGRKKKRGEEN